MSAANAAIFVPYAGCPHWCGFCNQRGISGADAVPDAAEVGRILARAAESLGERMQTAQIAFFGGSFTAIPRDDMLRLLEAARPFLGEGGFGGIRVSTRPDAIDREVLDILETHGVVAIELGAQSMDDGVLAASGRGHTAADTMDASRLIRERGFSLGLQMMTGLPGSDGDADRRTARTLIGLRPDTVRVYPTLVLRGTAFEALWRSGAYRPQTLKEATELGAGLLELFAAHGIPVIRLGLHDSPSLAADILAGPHHPAFRELCEGRVLLRKALGALDGAPPGDVRLRVRNGSASKMAGQRRCNLLDLQRRGYRTKILEDETIPYLNLIVEYNRAD